MKIINGHTKQPRQLPKPSLTTSANKLPTAPIIFPATPMSETTNTKSIITPI